MLLILLVFSAIVHHYSQFNSGRSFVLSTEEIDSVVVDGKQADYQRFLVRNRYPFVLTATARLCRIEGDGKSPQFSVLETRRETFVGKRSWYSGAYETRFTIAASNDGRFAMIDQTGTPREWFAATKPDSDMADTDALPSSPVLPTEIAKSLADAIRKEQLTEIREIDEGRKLRNKKSSHWFFTLPGDDSSGDNADEVLVITLIPVANYE